MNEDRPKYFWLITILVIFLITLGLLVYYIRFRTSITPKASSYNIVSPVSISNSYVFSSPIRAKANGDLIRITVFILDDLGNGIYDKKVNLRVLGDASGTNGVEIKDIQSLTDETGKAIFDVASSITGVFYIEAYTDEGLNLPQNVRLVFD